jgi:hypothetical protein
MNQDPIGELGGINLYGFNFNNPLGNVDPYGLWSFHDYLYQAGQGIYDWMMGDTPGRYDPNALGALMANEGMGIDRNNNVLRDSIGEGLATAGGIGKEAALNLAGAKMGELAGHALGALLPRAKRLANCLPFGKKVAQQAIAPLHHVATAKNYASAARGGPWSPRFEALFKKAGMTLEDALNKVRVPGHFGPHPEAYHQAVYDRLLSATSGLSGSAFTKALQAELIAIGTEATTAGTALNKLLTAAP